MKTLIKHAPAFDFFPERFWFAVEGWSEQDICRYWRLLGHQWMRGFLPADLKELTSLARGKLSGRIVEKFPVAEDGLRRNGFMETLRAEQVERILANRYKQTLSAWKRWHPGEPLPPHLVSQEVFRAHAAGGEDECPGNAVALPQGIPQAMPQECPPPTTAPSPPTTHPDGIHTPREGGDSWPTLEEVIAYSERGMTPRECAEKFWNQHEGTGWMLNNVPIRKWQPIFDNYATSWKANEYRRKPAGRGQPSPAAHQAKPPGLFGSAMDKYRTDKKEGQP
ncbi:hypothetical protein [Verrucomicrobium sp. BvORR034]|uniref:hypothetical protein n=1 Tax=Verrucomicrobium sp. BvORR034 TaxID=1396418 RepID=UPI00067995E0|nr:hypothetical protein [Verrucomicrobium sp. BvORR034]